MSTESFKKLGEAFEGVFKPVVSREFSDQQRYQLMRNYGLTPEQFRALFDAQNGLCAICQEPMEDPHVDHSHETGKVRGLLCARCNSGLGFFKDDPEALLRARLYLMVPPANRVLK